MCRWMAYSGDPVPLELFLFQAEHNLIDQSMSSRSAETPTNGMGFGVGWYGSRATPGLSRSIRPAWNEETNCHPFRWKNWLSVHNGEIFDIEKLRRDLLMAVAPEYFGNIVDGGDLATRSFAPEA